MSLKSQVRLGERGVSNNWTVGKFERSRTTVRSASLQRLRMRFRFTADLCSLVDAYEPTKNPSAFGCLRGGPGTQRIRRVLPFHTLPFLMT